MLIEAIDKESTYNVLIIGDKKEIDRSAAFIQKNIFLKINITKLSLEIFNNRFDRAYHLIILEANEKRLNFRDVLNHIRSEQTTKNVPIIIISSLTEKYFSELELERMLPVDVIPPSLKKVLLKIKVITYLNFTVTEKKLNYVQTELKQIKKNLKQQNKQLKHLALHDQLTSTSNRYAYESISNQIIMSSKRHKRNFAMLLVDIDNFKWINDKFGHNLGNEVIKAVAGKLKKSLRDSDLLSRIGGDEFGIILTELNASSNAGLAGKKIFESFKNPIVIQKNSIRISLSMGITYYTPDKNQTFDELMEEADIAMYEAKENGKNRFEYFNSGMRDKYIYQNTLNYELQNAVNRNEFYLVYQPIMNIHNNRIAGLEALIRWNNPTLGTVPPSDFIPVAEQADIIYDIGLWILNQACSRLSEWKAQGYTKLFLSTNISPKQIQNPNFGKDLNEISDKYRISPDELELEITESKFTFDLEKYIKNLDNFKGRLSIDDFGVQYSSLSRLGKLPVNSLKIDGSFFHGVKDLSRNKIILKHLFRLTEELSIKVIAERIETEEQRDFLVYQNCTYAQGYYYYKPMPPEKITEILAGPEPEF
ncbi:MAG: bifunctional diguanylate cyclase/phosphodiesterase [Victivallales bacterium]|nr:bifunctional diguanylate cyclase/phosphodiesterase [Victivallales bacterium]